MTNDETNVLSRMILEYQTQKSYPFGGSAMLYAIDNYVTKMETKYQNMTPIRKIANHLLFELN